MSKQDRGGVRTAQDLERKYDLAGTQKAARQSVEGVNKINKELETFVNSTLKGFENLENKIEEAVDGSITTYYYSGVPTLSNLPSSEWPESEYSIHIGDIYYDKDTKYAYKFLMDSETGEYSWVEEASSEVAEVLEIANTAKDTADSKRRVFVVQPTPPYDKGDLWLSYGELYVCNLSKASGEVYAAGDFKKAVKYTDDTALNNFINSDYADDLKAINDQVDQKAETWYQDKDPSSAWTTEELKASHVGDLWYSITAEKSYIYTPSFEWEERSSVPDSVYDKLDRKAQIFASQPVPPYYVNDLYTQGSDGDILVCTAERLTGTYDAADWKKAGKYTDDTALETFVDITYTNEIKSLTDSINSKITTWYYSGVPTLNNAPAKDWTTNDGKEIHIGDLYYDKATGYVYRFNYENNTYAWGRIKDSELTEALSLASAASDTADSKRRVFVAQPAPPYDNGDLWLKDQELYVCQISKTEKETYSENDFIIATKYTDDTVANQVGDNLEVVRGTVTTIKEGVDAFKIDIETQVKTINDLQEETLESMERMSYTFGTKDLTIANSNDPVNTSINNQGLKVFNYRTLQSIFNHRGVGIQKLIVVGDTQLANLSIVKAKDENGEDCTDFNFLVSNIQSLSDLEGGS